MGIFKRLAPFFLTLTVGLLIASIFVDVASPFSFRSRRMQRWNEYQQMRCDYDRIRSERDKLKAENEALRGQVEAGRVVRIGRDDFTIAPVPAPNLDVPPPPSIRTAPRAR